MSGYTTGGPGRPGEMRDGTYIGGGGAGGAFIPDEGETTMDELRMTEVNELSRLLAAERAKTANLAQALARTVERVIELEDLLGSGELSAVPAWADRESLSGAGALSAAVAVRSKKRNPTGQKGLSDATDPLLHRQRPTPGRSLWHQRRRGRPDA